MVLLAGLAWLAFGYFGVHTLFVDDVVSEAAPVFDAPAPTSTSQPGTAPADPIAEDGSTEREPAAAAPSAAVPPATAPPTTAPPATAPPATAAPADEVVVEYEGGFVGESRYDTSGRAVVLGNGTGQRFLRLEGFETDNGPDLNVYLVNSSTGDVSDVIDLGDLRGNIGDQNYEIPVGVDLDVYDRVVIWCVRFGVGFGNAPLLPT